MQLWQIKNVLLCCFVPELLQTYTRRKAAKERAKQTEGVQHNAEDNKTSRETTKMALPQFEREKKNYTPCKYYIQILEGQN